MTIEELEQFVANVDANGLAAAVKGMPESERRKLSKATSKLVRELDKAKWLWWNSETGESRSIRLDRLDRWLPKGDKPEVYDQADASELAALAFCPLSVVRDTDARYSRINGNEAMVAILTDRRPNWIDDWVQAKFDSDWQAIDWPSLRTLIRTGVCTRPTSDGYIMAMTMSLPDSWSLSGGKYTPLSRKLLADPELLEYEVWRLFDAETWAFGGYESPDREPEWESWSAALRTLAAEGHLDRDRLLDSSLSGLTMGFNNRAITDYISFHNYLKPTIDEIIARQRTYIDLRANQASHVVTFALQMLKAIDKAGAMDDSAFLDGASYLLVMRTKTQPKTGLSMLKRILKRNPDLAKPIARTAAAGLTHPSPDIQAESLNLIELAGAEGDDELLAMLAGALDDIAATNRPEAEKLLAKLGGAEQAPEEPAAADLAGDISLLLSRCEALDSELRGRAGVDEAVATLDGCTPPAPLAFGVLDSLIPTSLERIEPVESFEELLDAVSHAVETVDSADEVERILDGISRLCDRRSDDFDRLVAPLVKRVSRRDVADTSRGLVHSFGAPAWLGCLLLTWLTDQTVEPEGEIDKKEVGPIVFLNARVRELSQRVARRRAGPLLAAPTHVRGWIAPIVLCERLIELQAAGMDALECDMIQALLRMAPHGRADALKLAGEIKGGAGKALRWSLGGDEKIKRSDRKHPLLWLAAGRARDQHGVLDALGKFGLTDLGADAIMPAEYSWKARISKHGYGSQFYRYPKLDVTIEPKGESGVRMSTFPTTALHARVSNWSIYGAAAEWLSNWIAMNWPINCDAFHAAGIEAMMWRIDDPSSTMEPNFAFLSPIFEPDRPLTAMACLALCVGLVGRDADARTSAIDALAEAIQDGRAYYNDLADILIKLSEGGWLKLNRLADALGEVARLSAMHGHVVACILERWLARQTGPHRDTHHVLTLLLELLSRFGLPLADEARGVLENLKGSSKTAKLARKLLSHEPEAPKPMLAEAMVQHLEGRVARAERWQAALRDD